MTRAPWDISNEMFLSVDEVDGLLKHVRARAREARRPRDVAAEVDRVIIEVLLFSGIRCSEFCRLAIGDVSPRRDEPSLAVRGGRGQVRKVWLPANVLELIHRYAREVRPRLVGETAGDGSEALIVNERGRGYERTGLYRRVVRILTEAGLGERASVQLLRHTYGYLAYLRTGGNLLFVQRQLGHAHPMVTAVYAQFADESYSDMADAITGSRRGGKRKARGECR